MCSDLLVLRRGFLRSEQFGGSPFGWLVYELCGTVRAFDGMCEKFPECVFLAWYAAVRVCVSDSVCVCMCVFFTGVWCRSGVFEGGQTAAFYCRGG